MFPAFRSVHLPCPGAQGDAKPSAEGIGTLPLEAAQRHSCEGVTAGLRLLQFAIQMIETKTLRLDMFGPSVKVQI